MAYRGSGMFYDLGQFLENNRGQAQGMADQLAGKVTTLGETAQKSIDLASDKGISDAEQARIANSFGGRFRGQYDDMKAKQFGDAERDTAAAEGAIQNMGTFSGNQQLLGQGKQNYTPGMGRLDSFLLGADPGARQTMNAAGQRFGGLRGMLDAGRKMDAPGQFNAPKPVVGHDERDFERMEEERRKREQGGM